MGNNPSKTYVIQTNWIDITLICWQLCHLTLNKQIKNSLFCFSDNEGSRVETIKEEAEIVRDTVIKLFKMTIRLKSYQHLFKYISEWNPEKKGHTHGGYLEGEIELPEDRKDLKIIISTHPVVTSDLPSELKEIHPALLHIVRKDKMRRRREREPIPNEQHWRQELNIINDEVIIINRTSQLDQKRNIPNKDHLLQLNGSRKLTLGGNRNEIKMVILVPKQTRNRTSTDDVTIQKVISERTKDEIATIRIQHKYEGQNNPNLRQVKLKVECYAIRGKNPILSSISEPILDMGRAQYGPIEIQDANPLMSCEEGGRRIIILSAYDLSHDVEPRYQLWNKEGLRQRHLENNKEVITQPIDTENGQEKTISIKRRSITFITPKQRYLSRLIEAGLSIRLTAQRKRDKNESRTSFKFIYKSHSGNCFQCKGNPDGPKHKYIQKVEDTKTRHKRFKSNEGRNAPTQEEKENIIENIKLEHTYTRTSEEVQTKIMNQ